MKFQLLPYPFKYVGLGLFLLFSFPSLAYDFYVGFTRESTSAMPLPLIISERLAPLGHIGLLIYLMAKDRVFDEYMLKLKLESAFMVVMITLSIITIIEFGKGNWIVNAGYFFEIQVYAFLVLNAIRKRL